MEKLTSLSDIYRFFRTLETPIYFVSGTPFNLLGLGQHVPSLHYINYFDCFDGHHYRVSTPEGVSEDEFTCMSLYAIFDSDRSNNKCAIKAFLPIWGAEDDYELARFLVHRLRLYRGYGHPGDG